MPPHPIPAVTKADGKFNKFVQFAKMSDSKDGQPTVWGIATLEMPDCDREVCDYPSAMGAYQTWSEAAVNRTRNAGQSISYGNIRLQHGSEVGGKVTKVDFRDGDRQIWLGSEPINDEVRVALQQGFYTGYSQGGSYQWRKCMECDAPMPMQQGYNWCQDCDKMVDVRYGLKRIAEVSYVDSPATGEGFQYVKANGSMDIVKFKKGDNMSKDKKTKRVAGVDLPASSFAYVGDPEDTSTWKLPIKFPGDEEKTKRHIRNALARFGQTKGIPEGEKEKVHAKIVAAAKEHGIDVDEETKSVQVKHDKLKDMIRVRLEDAAKAAGRSEEFRKSMWQVSLFADMLERFTCLYEAAAWEREIEGDESEVPDELRDLLDSLVDTFLNMATEEARELIANKNDHSNKGASAMTPEEQKAAKELQARLATMFAKSATFFTVLHGNSLAVATFNEAQITKLEALKTGDDTADAPILISIETHQQNVKAFKAQAEGASELAKSFADGSTAVDKDAAEAVTKSTDDFKTMKLDAVVKVAPKSGGDEDETELQKAERKIDREVINSPEFQTELRKRRTDILLKKMSEEGAEALKAEQIVPTGVKIVPRAGEKSEKGDNPNGYTFGKLAPEATTGPGI